MELGTKAHDDQVLHRITPENRSFLILVRKEEIMTNLPVMAKFTKM